MIRRLLALALLLLPRLVWAATCTCPSTPSDSYATLICSLSPCAYYRMEEGSGTALVNVADASNGTISGGVTFQQTGPILSRGGASKGILFNGTTGQSTYGVGAGSGPSKTNLAGWTSLIWVKPAASPGFGTMVAQEDPGSFINGWAIYQCDVGGCGGAGYRFDMLKTNDTGCGHTTAIGSVSNAWHMITVTTVGNGTEIGTAILYVEDGTTSNTQSTFSGCGYSYTVPTLAASNGFYFLASTLSEFALFSTALSQVTIASIYNTAITLTGTSGMPFSVKRDSWLYPAALIERHAPGLQLDYGTPSFIVDRLNKKAIRSPGQYAP